MAAAEVADEVLVKARVQFAELSGNGGEALPGLVDPREPDELKSAALVSVCLNHCGFVGVSIRTRAMDEQMDRRWRRTACTRTWERAEAYVAAKRRTLQQTSLYGNSEWLAGKWKPEGAGL